MSHTELVEQMVRPWTITAEGNALLKVARSLGLNNEHIRKSIVCSPTDLKADPAGGIVIYTSNDLDGTLGEDMRRQFVAQLVALKLLNKNDSNYGARHGYKT